MESKSILDAVVREGVTAFHCVKYVKQQLLKAGFKELVYGEAWTVEENENYIVTPFPSMLFAIRIGHFDENSPVRIATAHTDSPCLKIKSNPELPGKYYAQFNVEPYGGLIKSTWFDRPLGVAGKVVLRSRDAFHPTTVLIDSKKPVCIIPSLAPHLAKSTDKKEMNIQKEMVPIIGLSASVNENPDNFLLSYIAEMALVDEQDILDYDLYLYNPEMPERVGLQEEMISAPRIDNLASVAALMEAMMNMDDEDVYAVHANANIMVAAMFDNEEIGSRSKQGADSVMLPQILDKLGVSLGIDDGSWKDCIAKGFLLSLDGAQGYHPNYSETSDPTNPVYLGEGIVIKTSATQRYLSDSEASAIIKGLCECKQIPCQQQVNRSGMPGGQTLGPILAAVLPLMGADVGVPMLAMHSARELAAYSDYEALVQFARIFYCY